MEMEADIGVMQPQTKELEGLLEATRSWETGLGWTFPLSHQEEHTSPPLGFQTAPHHAPPQPPARLCENQFV